MKRIVSIFLLCMVGILAFAQNGKDSRCTKQDVPYNQRPLYIKHAEQMLIEYYNQLPFNIKDLMIQEVFADRFMLKDNHTYMPEFLPVLNTTTDFLNPVNYMFELDKTFGSVNSDYMQFVVQNYKVDEDDFFNHGRTGLRLLATYDLLLQYNGNLVFERNCEAFCLFPLAKVFIDVKLMQVRPLKGNNFHLVDDNAATKQNTENDSQRFKAIQDENDEKSIRQFLGYCCESIGSNWKVIVGYSLFFWLLFSCAIFIGERKKTPLLLPRITKSASISALIAIGISLLLCFMSIFDVLIKKYPTLFKWFMVGFGLLMFIGGVWEIYSGKKKGKEVDVGCYFLAIMGFIMMIIFIVFLIK